MKLYNVFYVSDVLSDEHYNMLMDYMNDDSQKLEIPMYCYYF